MYDTTVKANSIYIESNRKSVHKKPMKLNTRIDNLSKENITIICFQFHVPDKKKEEKSQQTFAFD